MRSIALVFFTVITTIGASKAALALAHSESSIATKQADPLSNQTPVRVADKRNDRHCHVIHTRVYCHRGDQLPVNWPPFSDRTKKVDLPAMDVASA
jgi:hypothetical protein